MYRHTLPVVWAAQEPRKAFPCQSLGLTKAAAEHTQPVRCARHIAMKEQRNERSTAWPTASFKHLLGSVDMFPPLMKLMTMLTPQPHSTMQLLEAQWPFATASFRGFSQAGGCWKPNSDV